MASTDDLARLVGLADRHHWRLVCVGDPVQLPGSSRGRMFAHGASDTVAITTASTGTARSINVEIQRRRSPGQPGASVALADGTGVFVGDQVVTRRNNAGLVTNRGSAVRNRQTWTVTAIGEDGSLSINDPQRGTACLPNDYVAKHVELGWAVTGYGNQGVTFDHICVVEPASTRAGIYVAMTRGQGRNVAWVLDRTGLDDAGEVFAAAVARPPNARTAHAVRDQLSGPLEQPRQRRRVLALRCLIGHHGG